MPEEFESLPAILMRRAMAAADGWSLTFLDGERDLRRIGMRPFAAAVSAVARRIAAISAPGEPILLLYPPGADFLIGMMACLAANRPAVPINPPRRNRLIERVDGILADTGARIALTTSAMLADQGWWREADVPLARLDWQETDRIAAEPVAPPEPVQIGPGDTAFIQYTSGSTSAPKGVVVTHGNLIADLRRMAEVWDIGTASVVVTWLPAFHDLGLIFGLLQPLFSGCATVAMAPARFLQTPVLWLDAITRYRGTHTAGPSFAYDACLRRIGDAALGALDLSSLRMAMNAAEPIDPAVLAGFAARFAACGFSAAAMSPAYGLAETTLAITAMPVGAPPVLLHLDGAALEARGHAVEVPAGTPGARALIGCGRPLPDAAIRIVDPVTGEALPEGVVGEIWASGPTVAAGYWRQPAASQETFGARLPSEAAAYLRTGDLGFLRGRDLVVTGRLKDLIIIHGANHYPQDIERLAFRSHAALRPDCGAAFSLPPTNGDGERLVIVQEVERVHRRDAPKPMIDAIRDAVWNGHDLAPHAIVLIEPGAIPRTSSGKIRRSATRAALLEGRLPVVADWELPKASATPASRISASSPPPSSPPPSSPPPSLRAWLLGWLAERLELPEDRVELDESFASLGLDSVCATALVAALSERLGRSLSPAIVWDHPTPKRLAAFLSDAPLIQPAMAPASRGRDIEALLDDLEGRAFAPFATNRIGRPGP
ncbi:MAG: AMP-binding protein [Proteobacteria bacterium]|nr:AMP-binding protein [Pseudomonadota bacterium]